MVGFHRSTYSTGRPMLSRNGKFPGRIGFTVSVYTVLAF